MGHSSIQRVFMLALVALPTAAVLVGCRAQCTECQPAVPQAYSSSSKTKPIHPFKRFKLTNTSPEAVEATKTTGKTCDATDGSGCTTHVLASPIPVTQSSFLPSSLVGADVRSVYLTLKGANHNEGTGGPWTAPNGELIDKAEFEYLSYDDGTKQYRLRMRIYYYENGGVSSTTPTDVAIDAP